MQTKPFYLSKTLIFNFLTVVIAAATLFGFTPNQELFKQATDILLVLSPIVNVLLRFVTSKKVVA